MKRLVVLMALVIAVCPESVVDGMNKLASDIYNNLSQESKNVFISPYSISCALHVLGAGSRGTSLEQIYQALGVAEMGTMEVLKNLEDLQAQLTEQGLNSHNQLFIDQYFSLSNSYQVKSSVSSVDFSKAGLATARINQWVSERTDGKIKKIVEQGSISAATKLIIVNVINFKGVWTEKFKRRNTRLSPFYVTSTEHVEVKMMRQQTNYRYVETADYQAAALPFDNTEVELIIIKPKKDLQSLEQHLLQQYGFIDLSKIRDSMKYDYIDIKIPHVELSLKYNLNNVLQDHGIVDVFNPSKADLSDFTDTDSQGLCVSDVLHSTYLKIDEDGCEAAAATSISIMLTSGNIGQRKALYLDHPFIIALRGARTGIVLFLGKQVDFDGERRSIEDINRTEL